MNGGPFRCAVRAKPFPSKNLFAAADSLTVRGNYYEDCDTAHHFDNRGMNWENPSCNCSCGGAEGCAPFATDCMPSGVAYVLASADGSEWADRWPELKQLHSPCVPVNNTVSANTFCRCDAFTDQSNETYHEWGGVLANNTEVSCD